PLLVLFGYSTLLVFPVLSLAMAVKVSENGTDYSLQKTSEQALYLVTSRSAKYKAKAINDTVFLRLGAFLAAACVALLVALAVPSRGVVAVTLLFAAALLAISIALARLHRQRAAIATPAAPPRLLICDPRRSHTRSALRSRARRGRLHR